MKKTLRTILLLALVVVATFCFAVGCGGDNGDDAPKNNVGELEYTLVGEEYIVSGIGTFTGTNLVIPSMYEGKPVTKIGEKAFYQNSGLESVKIPNSVTCVEKYAFVDCDSLKSVVFEEESRLTQIKDDAFLRCSNLTSIEIPKSVEKIGLNAFYLCYRLVEVVNRSSHFTVYKDDELKNGMVGEYALNVYNGQESYTSRLATNENGFVTYNTGAEKILVNYVGNNTDITIPSGISKINNYAFYMCKVKSVNIPNGVMSIGKYAFEFCSSLIDANISSTVKIIDTEAFSNCKALKNVTFAQESQLATIGYRAFWKCIALTEIEIPSSVTSLIAPVFLDCTSLLEISVEEGNAYFKAIDGNLYSKDGKTLLQYSIGKTATEFSIPSGVEVIGKYAFRGSATLKTVEMPTSVITIGEYAFSQCSALSSINISNSVYEIQTGAFGGCKGISSIIIPISVKRMGMSVFSSWSKQQTIYCEANSKPNGWDSYWKDFCSATITWGYKG